MAAFNWQDTPGCLVEDAASISCLVPLFKNVVTAVTAFSGVALFIMLLVGGFNYLLSGGDQKKLEAARGTLTTASTGLIVIVSAYLILSLISQFTKVDVTQFKLFIE